MTKPLEGIKIIEIAQEIQGPLATLFLADLGAEVTKVENRESGDVSRYLQARLIGGAKVRNANVSHYFYAMNRGKRSITADLKKKAGPEKERRCGCRAPDGQNLRRAADQLPPRRARTTGARLRPFTSD